MADTSALYFPHELDALDFPVGTAEISVSVSMPSVYGASVTLLSGTFAGDGEGVRVDSLAAMIRAQQRLPAPRRGSGFPDYVQLRSLPRLFHAHRMPAAGHCARRLGKPVGRRRAY